MSIPFVGEVYSILFWLETEAHDSGWMISSVCTDVTRLNPENGNWISSLAIYIYLPWYFPFFSGKLLSHPELVPSQPLTGSSTSPTFVPATFRGTERIMYSSSQVMLNDVKCIFIQSELGHMRTAVVCCVSLDVCWSNLISVHICLLSFSINPIWVGWTSQFSFLNSQFLLGFTFNSGFVFGFQPTLILILKSP